MPRLSSLSRHSPPRRRTRKKGPDGQHVWPVHLEFAFGAAYVDGMRERANSSTRSQNSYIARRFELYTGLHRTRSQVASHLQQIRKWSEEDYGCRDAWEQGLQWTTTDPTPVPSSSLSPMSSASQLSSPLGVHTNIMSTDSPMSSSLFLLHNLGPFQPDPIPHLAPVAQYQQLSSSHTLGLGLVGQWDPQGPLNAVSTLHGLSSAEPQYSMDADFPPVLRYPNVTNGNFF